MNLLYAAVLHDLRTSNRARNYPELDLPEAIADEADPRIEEYLPTGDPVVEAQIHLLLTKKVGFLDAHRDNPGDYRPIQIPENLNPYQTSRLVSMLLRRTGSMRKLNLLAYAESWNAAAALANILLDNKNGWPHRTSYSGLAEFATDLMAEDFIYPFDPHSVDQLLTELKAVAA